MKKNAFNTNSSTIETIELDCEKLNNDQADKTSSASSNKTDDEKCAVCLQIFSKSKSYAPNCFHSFCFECLLEWSNIKHECP